MRRRGGKRWRREKRRRIDEVKELGHIVGCCITRGKRLQSKASFNQLENRGGLTVYVRDEVRLDERRDHNDRHTEAAQSKVVAGRVIGAKLRWNVVWRNDRERRNVVIETAAFIIREDEDGVVPCRAVHQRIDEGLYISCAQLDVAVRMFVQAGATEAGVDPHDRRQISISSRAGEDIEIVFDWSSLVLDVQIVPIGEARQEDCVREVVSPTHACILQPGEDCRAGPLRRARGRGEYSSLRGGTERILAIGDGIGRQGRGEGVTGGKLRRQLIVIRQIALVILAKSAQARVVEFVSWRRSLP